MAMRTEFGICSLRSENSGDFRGIIAPKSPESAVCSGFSRFAMGGNSQGGVSPKYHSFVEFAFDERNLGDLGLRI